MRFRWFKTLKKKKGSKTSEFRPILPNRGFSAPNPNKMWINTEVRKKPPVLKPHRVKQPWLLLDS
jgi:hypothetical protein